MGLPVSGWEPMADFSEHGNEALASINSEETLDQLLNKTLPCGVSYCFVPLARTHTHIFYAA
jgi:hypothetical protein